MTTRVEHADMLEAIPRLVAEGVVCDAVVTDPPYGLSFMRVAWDTMPVGLGRTNLVRDPAVKWDGGKSGDIAFRPETWATVATILRPGAFVVAFGGTRTHHRMACAIEDGGFVIQDCILWLYATGFPKRRDMRRREGRWRQGPRRGDGARVFPAGHAGSSRMNVLEAAEIAHETVAYWRRRGFSANDAWAALGRHRGDKPDWNTVELYMLRWQLWQEPQKTERRRAA